MIAYVTKSGSTYNIILVEDPETNEIVEKLDNLSQSEYDTWESGAIASGTTIEIFEDPTDQDPDPNMTTDSMDPGTDVPQVPSDTQDQSAVQQHESAMKDRNLFIGSAEDLPPPPEDTSLRDAAEKKEEDEDHDLDGEEDPVVPVDQPSSPTAKADLDKGDMNRPDSAPNCGLLDRQKLEPVPIYEKIPGDVVTNGKNNQWLCFIRDTAGPLNSGYGPGEGDDQAGAIDLCVGRMAPHPRVNQKVRPIFNYDYHEGRQVCDAARIYISQKTDVDKNFKIVGGRQGMSVAKSAIALKADCVRVISRANGIKLITHSRSLMDSQGGSSSRAPSGIDIIAGNDDSNLQPMVLGNNLNQLLLEYGNAISEVVGIITSLIQNIASLDTALATHVHPQAHPAGLPNIPSPNLIPVCTASLAKLTSVDSFSAFAEKFEQERLAKLYLQAGSSRSIRSSFNNVN